MPPIRSQGRVGSRNFFFRFLADNDYEERPDVWTKPGLLTAADRRRLYVKWLSEVWEEIDQRQSMILVLFSNVAC